MRRISANFVWTLLVLSSVAVRAQVAGGDPDGGVHVQQTPSSILAWTPPALEALAQQAEIHNSFVLDRTTLSAMQALLPESDETLRPAIRKLDGISVRLYRFRDLGLVDPAQLEQVRHAYSARGWKHLVSEGGSAGPNHKKTDLWLAFDGMTVRGGAMMLVTPKSVSLITFVGDLSPVDLLHLRGHFGIPAANGDSFMNAR